MALLRCIEHDVLFNAKPMNPEWPNYCHPDCPYYGDENAPQDGIFHLPLMHVVVAGVATDEEAAGEAPYDETANMGVDAEDDSAYETQSPYTARKQRRGKR